MGQAGRIAVSPTEVRVASVQGNAPAPAQGDRNLLSTQIWSSLVRASGRRAIPLLPLVGVLLLWALGARLYDDQRFFPTPVGVAKALGNIFADNGVISSPYTDIVSTLYRLLVAFIIAMIVGVALGIAAGRYRMFFAFLSNILWISMAVPSIVWVFIFAVAVGLSNVVPVAALCALMTPAIVINLAEGTKAVPGDIVEMAASYKVGWRDRLRHIYLPHLTPYIVSSARVAFALNVKLIIVAEVVGLSSGIGYEVNYWNDSLQMAPVIAWGIVLIAVGWLVDGFVLSPLARRAARWRAASDPRHGLTAKGQA